MNARTFGLAGASAVAFAAAATAHFVGTAVENVGDIGAGVPTYRLYLLFDNQLDCVSLVVSLSGDTLVVGVRLDDDNGEDAGAAYVFERAGGVWEQKAKLTADDGGARPGMFSEHIGDNFGSSVSVSGTMVVVGAPLDDTVYFNSGSVYVFERVGDAWKQTARHTASDAFPRDKFGSSVSVSGATWVSGAPLDDDNRVDSGSAYAFDTD